MPASETGTIPKWVFDVIWEELTRNGLSYTELFKLTERQWKLYFVDGCLRSHNENLCEPEYGDGVLGCEIVTGLEEISKFFLPPA